MSETIGEIFRKHPSELTREDVDRIVEAYKEHMGLLQANGPKAFDPKTGEPKKVRRRKVKATVDPLQIDLDLEGEGK